MGKLFAEIPEFAPDPDFILRQILSVSPNDAIRIAKYSSELIRIGEIDPKGLLDTSFDYFERSSEFDEQAKTLLFLVCLEGQRSFWEGTPDFLKDLKERHGFDDDFSLPFQRFISQRLRILAEPGMSRGFDPTSDTRQILELLQGNRDFFDDLLTLQKFFSEHISPIMPLNATWNPELTERFRVKGATGLWFIYSHNLRVEYLEIMKRNLSSEWTGFNRFVQEPWEVLKARINTRGNLVDIGSSIGIAALEIAQALDMQGTVILVDYYNPYRNMTSLRIVDYADPQRRLISIGEALARVEALRGGRVVMQLFGADAGKPLTDDVHNYMQDASFVHLGNLLPYIPREKLYYVLVNALEATSRSGGIMRVHNDEALPVDSLLTSLTFQRAGDGVQVLRDLVKDRV